jgi:hypothetical protein
MEIDFYVDVENQNMIPNMKKQINKITVGFYIFFLVSAVGIMVWLGLTYLEA